MPDVKPDVKWADIPGYADKYNVSSEGEVWSVWRNKLLRRVPTPNGYVVCLRDDEGGQRNHWVHRLVLLAFCPIAQPRHYRVKFGNDDKFDCSLSNLSWVLWTNPHLAKLRSEQVREIRALWLAEPTLTHHEIAARYGVSRATVTKIIAGDTWGHVK